jgi:hypothetical protein
MCGIKQKFSMAYRAASQGIVERSNLSIITALKSMVNKSHTDWPSKLPLVTMALNGSVNKSISQSPYTAVFGNEVTFLQDLAIPAPTDFPTNVTDALQSINESRQLALDIVREKQQKSSELMKQRYDNKARAVTPVLNEIVYLHSPNLQLKDQCRKLAPTFMEPFCIDEILYDKAVRLRRLSDGLLYTKPIHMDRLKFQRPTTDERK